jgi:SAM-dependent methyltransferase
MTKNENATDFVEALEATLKERSDELEETHLQAAMDAELTDTSQSSKSTSNPEVTCSAPPPMFDYINPNAVANCLSPYVPTDAAKIASFVTFAGLQEHDVLLDIGCGDGRVCVAATKLTGCAAIGIDVSPPCISMARQIANEQAINATFYELDATMDPDRLLQDSSLANVLSTVSCIFLYTYPTLLVKLVPLLSRLTAANRNVRVVTLTYHLNNQVIDKKDDDFCMYSNKITTSTK